VCAAESLSTLKFANRAKNIRNAARVNEDVDQRTLLRKYERELRRLRAELQQRQRELVDKRHLLEVCLLDHTPAQACQLATALKCLSYLAYGSQSQA
jgi:Skp family chaperone for outer membrane proteins